LCWPFRREMYEKATRMTTNRRKSSRTTMGFGSSGCLSILGYGEFRRGSPQPVELVKIPDAVQEDVHHEIVVVDQDPPPFADPLHPHGAETFLLERFLGVVMAVLPPRRRGTGRARRCISPPPAGRDPGCTSCSEPSPEWSSKRYPEQAGRGSTTFALPEGGNFLLSNYSNAAPLFQHATPRGPPARGAPRTGGGERNRRRRGVPRTGARWRSPRRSPPPSRTPSRPPAPPGGIPRPSSANRKAPRGGSPRRRPRTPKAPKRRRTPWRAGVSLR